MGRNNSRQLSLECFLWLCLLVRVGFARIPLIASPSYGDPRIGYPKVLLCCMRRIFCRFVGRINKRKMF